MGNEILPPSSLVESDGSIDETRALAATPETGRSDGASTRRGQSPALSVPADDTDLGKEPDAMERRRLFESSSAAPRIGRFLVLEEIGRGGMGVVYSAYDEQLDRKVALKVLREDEIPGVEERQRLRREAQALARLSHPNVVSVHEVGEDEGTVFVAMEFIRGVSVRDWLEDGPEVSQVLDAFVQAGRGLMAAHAEGLVHRDFKPHNMMRSEDEVVKVLDFGLARADASLLDESVLESPHGPSGSGTVLCSELTRRGVVMGTPPYMAPEQHGGAEVDARTDQYSFCVTLWESLTGARPFVGSELDSLLAAKIEGPPPWPSSAPTVPRSVVDALKRGLAANPAKRWPSMEPLLEVLGRQRGHRRGRWVLGATALVLAVGTAAAYDAWTTAHAQRCSGAERQLDGVWDEARRDGVRAAIEGTGKSYAPAVWERTARTLDEYTGDWVSMHTEACEATTVRGEQSGAMMDLRMACLHRAVVDLRAVVETLEDADDGVVKRAHTLLAGLRPVSRCGEVEALSADVEPPRPDEAEAVATARRELARSRSLRRAGRYDAARDAMETAKAMLDGVEYGPVQTESSLEAGEVLLDLADYAASEAALKAALENGARWHQREQMQTAASRLMFVVGARLQRAEEGLSYVTLARGLASGQPKAEASVRANVAKILFTQGKYAEAEAEHRAVLTMRVAALGPDHPTLATSRADIGAVLSAQGKYAEAEAEYRAALSVREAELGPDHPELAELRNELGGILASQDEIEEAEVEFRAALAVFEEALGPDHPNVGMARSNLGTLLRGEERYVEAEAEYRIAVSLMAAALGPDHPDVVFVRNNLGNVLRKQGKYEEAEAELRAVLALSETRLRPDHPELAAAHGMLGSLFKKQDKYAEAEAEYRVALSLWEAALGPDHPEVAAARGDVGSALKHQGKYEEAVAEYRIAVSVMEATLGPDHSEAARMHNNLGTVLRRQGKHAEAEAEFRIALAVSEAAMGPDDPATEQYRDNLAETLRLQGKDAEADRLAPRD